MTALLEAAHAAKGQEDWAGALEKLQAVLALEPTHAEATAQVLEVRHALDCRPCTPLHKRTTPQAVGMKPLTAFGKSRNGNGIIRMSVPVLRPFAAPSTEKKPRLRLDSLPACPLWEAVPHGQVVPRPDGSWAPWHCCSG